MRASRRHLDLVAVALIALGLLLSIRVSEAARADAAVREYDALTGVAAEQVDTWLDDHLAFQRSLAFLEPGAPELGTALEPGYVAFALYLDGDGRVLATYPARPDLGPGSDLSGRFPHIDQVLDGADQAFWASDAATTTSGSVAATAVSGPGQPATVLTFAFDLSETTLPRLISALLDTVDGARWQITDTDTGIAVFGPRTSVDENARRFSTGGWQLDISAPTSSVHALVGGTADWTIRGAAFVLVGALGIAVAVRRRRLASERALGLSGDLRMFEMASTPCLLLDPVDHTVLRANASMADLLGVQSARHLDGASLDSVLVSDDPQVAPLDVDDALAEQGLSSEILYWRHGEQRWGRVAGARLERPDDGPLLLVEIHDLEDQRQREAVLDRQRIALEDVAGRVSHDLRTPITAMIGFAELLQRSPDAPDEARTEWLQRLTANARRLGEHVRDMAEVAVDVSDQPLTDVRACVARAIKLHDTSIHAAGAEVVNRVPQGSTVAMPELLLRQMFANLVDNAIKYRDRSRPLVVTIDASRRDDDDVIELSVCDNGPGIAVDRREAVFTAGVRGGPTTSPGSGLGLAMCRTLVEDFGGTLEVTDNEPVGARFSLCLPAHSQRWPLAGAAQRDLMIAERDEPLPSMFDHVPIGVLVLGEDHELVDANRIAMAEHGWQTGALPAEQWIDHLPDDGVRATVLDALFTGRTEQWQSASGAQAGLVMTLEGDLAGHGALVLWWPTSSTEADDLVHDELTGLPGRVVVRSRLVRALRDEISRTTTTAVFSIDLDDFRSFNERRGLSAGDQVLQAVADRLRSSAIDEDSVARQGADEFVVVRPGLSGRDEALRVAERARAHVGAPITLADGSVVTVSCSIGVALAGSEHDPDLLLIAAAQALHEAQRTDQRTAVVEVS